MAEFETFEAVFGLMTHVFTALGIINGSLFCTIQAAAIGSSPPLTPCSARSSSMRRLRSTGVSSGSSSGGTLFGSASNASLISLDDMPRQRPKSGRFKAGALEAACHRMRHLYPSAMTPLTSPATQAAARKVATPALDSSTGGAAELLAQVSQSAEHLQRRQQAEGRLLQRRMESTANDVAAVGGAAPMQPPTSVAAGCAALQKGHSRFQFPPVLAAAE